MSVVTLQVGQCGNQLGSAFFSTVADAAVDRRGDVDQETAETFFRESCRPGSHVPTQRWAARAILMDMEAKVIAATLPSGLSSGAGEDLPWQYDRNRSFHQQSGCGNNWAAGFHTYGPQFCDQMLELIRKEVEECDHLGGFLLLQSMAGGTGAGLGAAICEAVRDEFPSSFLLNHSVWPYTSGEVIVQSYNTVLSLSHAAEKSDGLLLVENELLHRTCQIMLGIKSPSFQIPSGSMTFETFNWPSTVKRLRQMLITGSKLGEGMNWNLRPTDNAGINRSLANYLVLRGQDSHRADISEFADPRLYCPWAWQPLMAAVSPRQLGTCEMTACLLSNSQACLQPVRGMLDKAYRMFSSQAFTHQYIQNGLSPQEFETAFSKTEDLIARYECL